MRIFAGALGSLFELIFLLVIAGIMGINKVLANRKEQEPPPLRRPQRRPIQEFQGGMNPMESKDVDQFLDEVLGRGAARPKPPPQQQPPPVVVLRPTNQPLPPQARLRPEPPKRPVTRPVMSRPVRQVRPVKTEVPASGATPRSQFSENINRDVDKAAAATTEAGGLGIVLTATLVPDPIMREVIDSLRSAKDVRRAILLREILGPPVALRRRRI